MNEHEFEQKLSDLIGQIDDLPSDQQVEMREVADQTRTRHDKLKKTVKDLQESMDYLRLSVKYLVFDLEATKRENRYLRKMLESASNGDHGQYTGPDDGE